MYHVMNYENPPSMSSLWQLFFFEYFRQRREKGNKRVKAEFKKANLHFEILTTGILCFADASDAIIIAFS